MNSHGSMPAALPIESLPLFQLEQAMQAAVARHEFLVDYQPIFRLQSGDMIGAEALVRWRHPPLGLLAPATFIPVAEKTGLIVPIGRFVLEQACRLLHIWQTPAMRGLSVSVNVSTLQLAHGDFVRTVRECVEEYGIDPRRLRLEITETAPIPDHQLVVERLAALRRLGTRIVLDDFGCGYMSLRHLTTLPVDGIKIDATLTAGLPDEPRVAAIISTVIELAARLDLSMVVEGVETARQAAWLNTHERICVQGYLYARPQPRLYQPLRIRTPADVGMCRVG